MQKQNRVIIDQVYPRINGGDFFIKRVVGEIVNVKADVLVDGHDLIGASVRYKHEKERSWKEVRMAHIVNDEWSASFTVEKQGLYLYKVEGWVDHALNWQHGIERKIDDGQRVTSELLEGVEYLKPLLKKADSSEKKYLKSCIESFTDNNRYDEAISFAVSGELHSILYKYPVKVLANESKSYEVYVDRLKARFSSWYYHRSSKW